MRESSSYMQAVEREIVRSFEQGRSGIFRCRHLLNATSYTGSVVRLALTCGKTRDEVFCDVPRKQVVLCEAWHRVMAIWSQVLYVNEISNCRCARLAHLLVVLNSMRSGALTCWE